jgi:hypothetical protein
MRFMSESVSGEMGVSGYFAMPHGLKPTKGGT